MIKSLHVQYIVLGVSPSEMHDMQYMTFTQEMYFYPDTCTFDDKVTK